MQTDTGAEIKTGRAQRGRDSFMLCYNQLGVYQPMGLYLFL